MSKSDFKLYDKKKRAAFGARLSEIFRCDIEAAQKLLSRQLKSSIRLNSLVGNSSDTLARLGNESVEIAPIKWCDGAYHLLTSKHDVAESRLFREGFLYIQNASSLVPPLVLRPQRGDRVLDVCAAPGGKAAHIAALTDNDCELVLNDSSKPRVEKLREIVDTFQVRVSRILSYPGQYLDKFIDGGFDRILLDAQCSGEGMIDLSRPRALRFWSESRIRKYSFLQRKMLSTAFRLLVPGGVLVYSTCTFAPEENEEPVAHLLYHNDDAYLEEIGLSIPGTLPGLAHWGEERYPDSMKHGVRIVPGEWMEGFFVCRIRKSA